MNIFKKLKEKKNDILKNAYDINGKPDYNYYIMSKSELNMYRIVGILLFFLIGYTFYKSVIISLIFSLFGLFFPEYMYTKKLDRRKKALNSQFKDMLYSISSSLMAGKSVETAFFDSKEELYILYPDENTDIIRELGYITNGLKLGDTIESLLESLAKRSHDEDIENFADVFISCKRTGGISSEIIKITTDVITEKIEIKRDIASSLSEKKFEQKAMSGLMLLVILGLSYLSGDYMDVMFTTVSGRFYMTIALIIFIISYVVGEKIMNIEV